MALLGSLLGSGPGHGQALNLHVPLLVATAGDLIAAALAFAAIGAREHTSSRWQHVPFKRSMPNG